MDTILHKSDQQVIDDVIYKNITQSICDLDTALNSPDNQREITQCHHVTPLDQIMARDLDRRTSYQPTLQDSLIGKRSFKSFIS